MLTITNSAGQPVELEDVVIIGSGPAGYTAAIYAARAGLSVTVVAGSLEPGGELMKTTEVENYPGFQAGIQGPELMANLQEQAERFGAKIIYENAIDLLKTDDPAYTVSLEYGEFIHTKAVIASTGAAYRKLNVDYEAENRLAGHGISYCATCDGFFFKDKYVAVIGGGDSALEEANFLTKFAKKVFLIHRRDSFKASKAMQDKVFNNPKIEIIWNAEVSEFIGEEKLAGITLSNGDALAIDGLFVAIGSIPRADLFDGLVELDDQGFIKVKGRSSLTGTDGLFACGDVIDPKYRQAITAAASGCVAALDVEEYLG